MSEHFLIGTYTKTISKGVYQIEFDSDKKRLTDCKFVAKVGDPTYLAESKEKQIYAIDKTKDEAGQTVGGLAVIDATNNELPYQVVTTNLEQPTSPAYVSIDEGRQLVYTANYHFGFINVYAIQNDGSLKLNDHVASKGTLGFRPEQQDGPHPHIAKLTPDNRLVVCDLGVDKVEIYDIKEDDTLKLLSEIQLESGFGPRHIVFANDGKTAYVVGELSSQVATLAYNPETASFTSVQIVKTIPADFTGHNGAAAIRISKDGRFVYVSNRGDNSLVVFAIGEKNQLKQIQRISVAGNFPRDFNFNQDQKFVIVVNQKSNNATLYERDVQDGLLTMIQKDFEVPEGVCIIPKID